MIITVLFLLFSFLFFLGLLSETWDGIRHVLFMSFSHASVNSACCVGICAKHDQIDRQRKT